MTANIVKNLCYYVYQMASKILFGTAGIPLSCNGTAIDAMETLNKLKLDAMEIEFVHGVHMKKDYATELKKSAEKNAIALTVHAPYYINLNAREKEKIEASKKRIIDSATIGSFAGAKSVAIHAAYFMGQENSIVEKKLEPIFQELVAELDEKNIEISLAPETSGKKVQFGSLEEHLQLASAVKGLRLCIDFSHLHAREKGAMKSKKDFEKIFETVEKSDKKFLQGLHMHCSGIAYSAKGEKNHLPLKESDFRYNELMQCLKEFNVSGILICESPNLEEDAILLKKTFENI